MVCKDDLCRWFKNLSPHKRIDYMCGMLQMCLPMELRFIGSYVEDLAKKDFHQLRESEGKANNRHELSRFNETNGKVFRTKMAVYLALMHSSNRSCSNIIFKLLEKHVCEALTVIDTMDSLTVHSILLVLSMAMNHPAFTFHQKSRMFEYYREASEAAERIMNKTLQEPELLILSESCDFRSCDQRLSPMCSPRVPQMNLIPSPVVPLTTQYSHSPATHEKVYVCKIDMKGYRQREQENSTIEYTIQVTWSNGEKKNVFKTYQELVEFHRKLISTFEDRLSLEETPKLPTLTGTQNHRIENQEVLSQYLASLSNIPEHIRQSNFFKMFFDNSNQRPVEMADACTSPRPPVLANVPVVQRLPNSGDEDAVIDQSYDGQLPSQNVYTPYLSQSPINGDMCNLSPNSPSHHEIPYQAAAALSPCSAKTTSPLISSPCHSPVSSMESPANSVPGSPSVHDRDETSQQVASMRIDDIAAIGVPKPDISAIKTAVLDKLKEKQPPYLNGLIDSAQTGVLWQPPAYIPHPAVPSLATMPPLQYHPTHPGAYAPVYNYQSFQEGSPMVPGTQDISPTNSEYSSPSPSPHMSQVPVLYKSQQQLQHTDSSSEDGERDKKPGQYRGSVRGKGHSAPNSARSARPERPVDMKQDNYSSRGTPPLQSDKCDINVNNGGSNGSSGYTSDPTSTRPLMRTHKAQPAHTSNMQPHSNVLINMPENNFKGGAQPFIQMMAPPYLKEINMNSAPADISHRSMIYFPQGQSLIARSHFNPVNVTGSRQIFHPQAVNQPIVPAHSTVMNGNAPVVTGSKGKGLHGSPVGVAAGKSPNILMNGVDNLPQTSDASTHRCQATSAVVSSATSSSTVAHTSSGQSGTTNKPATCSSCGCPGHREGTIPSLFLPPMPTNMWPTPYQNGFVPMHMQMPHQLYHHMPYPNGLNQDMLYSNVYGMSHSNSAVVPGSSNVIYNHYNNHQTSAGGYNQKKPKKINCHNCGSVKHTASDCVEVSMEAMSGPPIYSFKPKNDSD